MTTKFDDAQRANAVDAVHRALRSLREHWDSVCISCIKTDTEGITSSYEVENNDDEEDE